VDNICQAREWPVKWLALCKKEKDTELISSILFHEN
jgi:hypothetical protein